MKVFRIIGWSVFALHISWFLIFLFQKLNEQDFTVKNLGIKLTLLILTIIIAAGIYFFILRKIELVRKIAIRFGRIMFWLYVGFVAYFIFCTFFNPPITLTQLGNLKYGLKRDYVGAGGLGENIKLAVISSEDQLFPDHDGFDLKAIQKAMKYNQRHPGRQRGASTISQQTAKNIFLWQGGGFLRKGLEVFCTFTIEQFWSKKKILTRYLNVVEMGKGVFGAEAAAMAFFNKHAKDLTANEAAQIAASLPNPKIYTVKPLTRYVKARAGAIQAQMNVLDADKDVLEIIR